MNGLYIDAFSGLSGDLFLGALVDLGCPAEVLVELPVRLRLPDTRIRIETVTRRGIAAKRVTVEYGEETRHRHLSHIRTILENSDLPPTVIERTIQTFSVLAEAEAHIHGTTSDKVHFHEVGAVDAIIDITGTQLGIHHLRIERIVCSPLPLSRGKARMAHGTLPLPAPATVEILKGVPTVSIGVDFETVTPTGAALAANLADSYGEWPEMTPTACGWGAATHEGGDLPNLLRLILGTFSGTKEDRIWVLECEVDDMNPEFLEPLWSEVFRNGALDLYLTPVQMKKGRQGVLLTLLVDEVHRIDCEQVLLAKTTTFGVRRYRCERTVLDREMTEVETEFGPIPIKVAKGFPGKGAPEASAVKEAADRAGVPMSLVYSAAMAAWLKSRK